MWKQVGRPFFRTKTSISLEGTQQFDQNSNIPPRGTALTELEPNEELGAFEWYQCLTSGEKKMLQNMVMNLVSQGASLKTVVRLVSQRFSIGERLSRDVVLLRGKEDAIRNSIKKKTAQEEDVKSQSSNSSLLNSDIKREETPKRWLLRDNALVSKESPRKPVKKQQKPEVKIKLWERKVAKKHSYKDEVFKLLVDEEKRQATAWHIVREGAARLSKFAPERRKCIESIIKFSVKYKLLPKTTEASFIHLYRFLLLSKAQTIVQSTSGLKGAIGRYPLRTVGICILMISAKYEEIYPPVLSVFAEHAQCTTRDLAKLERRILYVMNWSLVTITPIDFLGRYAQSVRATKKTNTLAMFILEASWQAEMAVGTDPTIFQPYVQRWLQTGRFGVMPTTVLMVAKPSEIALACLILSLAYQGKICFPVTLEYCADVRAGYVSEVVEGLHQQLRRETKNHVLKPSAIIHKYSQARYLGIGGFKPPTFRELLQHDAFRGTELATIYNQQSSITNMYTQSSHSIVL